MIIMMPQVSLISENELVPIPSYVVGVERYEEELSAQIDARRAAPEQNVESTLQLLHVANARAVKSLEDDAWLYSAPEN